MDSTNIKILNSIKMHNSKAFFWRHFDEDLYDKIKKAKETIKPKYKYLSVKTINYGKSNQNTK